MMQLQAAPIQDWLDGDWNSAIFDPVPNLIGEGLWAVLIVGVLVVAYYVAGDSSIAAPTVLSMLIAAMAIPLLPGTYLGYFNALVIIGFTVALYTTYRRFTAG